MTRAGRAFPIIVAAAMGWLAGCDDAGRCAGVSCSGHGVCYIEMGILYCNCDPGYVSDGLQRCLPEDSTDPCYRAFCSGYGTCVVEDGRPRCNCESGYHRSAVNPLNCAPDALDAETGEDGEDGEAEATLCGNGVVDPGEACDTQTRSCGDCGRGTQTCDPATCSWTDVPCIGDPGETCVPACPPGQCLNRYVSQTDPTCGCETYHHCVANCGNEGRGPGYDPWETPCGTTDTCTMEILPTDYRECHC
jgi:hypothetical protein